MSRPSIVIVGNVFDGVDLDSSLLEVPEVPEVPEDLSVSILIKDERIDRRARTSHERLLTLVEGQDRDRPARPVPGVRQDGRL